MIIFSMTATFGCLQNETLRLHDGLNILEEANEGGKSTWCAFLRAMFYGLESRKGGALSEKNRYTPWSGAAMRGEMELSWGGQRLTLRRFPKGASPFGGFQAVYTGTEEPFPDLTADNVGETILGVTKEVFQRTCFIPQGSIQFDGSADLEKRVAALAASGLEDVSFSQTERTLKDWRNAIQSNRSTGALPKKRERLALLRQSADKAEVLRKRASDAEGALADFTAQKAEVEADMALHRALSRQSRAARREAAAQAYAEKDAIYRRRLAEAEALPDQEALRKAQGDLAYFNALTNRRKSGEEAIAEAQERLAAAQAVCDGYPFSGKSGEEAMEEARAAEETLSARPKARLAHWVPMLSCAAAALGLIVVGLVTKAIHSAILLGVGGGVLVAGIAVSLALSAHGKKKRRREGEALLARYGVENPEELMQKAQSYRRHAAAREEAAEALNRAKNDQKALEQEQEELFQGLLAFCSGFTQGADSPITISAALSRALTQEGLLAAARAEQEQAKAVLEAIEGSDEDGKQDGQEPPLPQGAAAQPKRALAEDEAMLARLNHAIALYSDQLARAAGEMAAMGDEAERAETIAAEEEAISRLEEQYDALTIALEALTEANAALQSRFSPAVNQAAGELMSRLTGGRYTAVSFTREFQALADSGEGLHASQFLSQGTADQAYLALRLAICRLTFFQEELPPVVLDDALVTFDDTRLGYALELLSDLGRDRQVLLFTCQSREGQQAERLALRHRGSGHLS